MQIRFGYELVFNCRDPTPMILMLHAHPSVIHDLIRPDDMRVEPHVPMRIYHDGFGNTCTRIDAPAGGIKITGDGLISDSGTPEPANPFAREHPLELLPEDTLAYLLESRYCGTEALMADARRLFGQVRPGWSRVQAICDFVHEHVMFSRHFARPPRTAWQVYTEQQGDCRDFAHLAIALCRCLSIPARYCTGYLGDIGVPRADSPMEFAGWFEVYLGGEWHTFDPGNNQRRIGRILIARGRDAADVASSTSFGPSYLETCRVWTDEVVENRQPELNAGACLARYDHAT